MNYKNLLASSFGTAIAEIITLPLCTSKTYYQTNLEYNSIKDVYIKIYKTKGIFGFYNASFPAISSQIINTTTKFTFYHFIKNQRKTTDKDLFNNIFHDIM